MNERGEFDAMNLGDRCYQMLSVECHLHSSHSPTSHDIPVATHCAACTGSREVPQIARANHVGNPS